MFKYRITKYNPKCRSNNGAYIKNEWTSVSDIGKSYYEGEFTATDYINIEDKYISIILSFFEITNTCKVYIQQLEKTLDLIEIAEEECKYSLSKRFNKELYEKICNGIYLTIEEACEIARMILREYMWCKIYIDSQNYIEFGYDYYMYFISNVSYFQPLAAQKPSGIFIEEIKI